MLNNSFVRSNILMRSATSKKLSFMAVWLLLFASSSAFGQSVQSQTQGDRPLHMLVLGDSILWGQGLKAENKTWYHVKLWLEKNSGRRVVERIEAHSGAVIERSSLTDNLTSPNREVNMGLPTINDELDEAVRFYPDASQVDLVLVSGCGNDVGVQNLLNASNTGEVDEMTDAKCGKPVENLLRRIANAFPAAQIIVAGYYPFFSAETRNDFVVKALARRFFKTQPEGAPRMSSKEVFERLKVNSSQWHQTSNVKLAEAVRSINAEFGRERVMFVKVAFPAAYSFAAPQTHLWGFNRSPFRMTLLFLSFGKILLPSNDEVRKQRTASCNELYKNQRNDTTAEKKDRKALRLFCRYAALGHPNKKGAVLYADAITDVLKSSLVTTTLSNPP
jgi:lysophospholipase L1-like esterase